MPYHWCDTNRSGVVDNFDGDFFGLENFGFIIEWDVMLAGDVNADYRFSVADVVLLQKWLLNVPDTHLRNWKNGDFNDDGQLNVIDLSLMKRELLK